MIPLETTRGTGCTSTEICCSHGTEGYAHPLYYEGSFSGEESTEGGGGERDMWQGVVFGVVVVGALAYW